MAYKIAIAGLPNTGKSFSRSFLKNGEEVFVISPSHKMTYLKDSKGQPVKRLSITSDKYKTTEEVLEANKATKKGILKALTSTPNANYKVSGNFDVVKSMEELDIYLKYINKCMPHIKTVVIPDFTHFISNIISSDVFLSRNKGGEAFTRYLELAAEALNTFFIDIDTYRDDLIVVTEYHVDYDENSGMYKIFTPGGKMLTEKFLPDSYYDVFLYTHVVDEDKEPTVANRYKFVTHKTGKYNARCAGLFTEPFIPNDLQAVLDKVRKSLGQ